MEDICIKKQNSCTFGEYNVSKIHHKKRYESENMLIDSE
jgi:hypothetical protein